jgi:site-specific DNA-cytosine methylase
MKFPKFDKPTLLNHSERGYAALPTGITLFSGLGSSSLALRDLGETVLAHDFLPEACASLLANGFDVVQGDIREVDFTDPIYQYVKKVVGGPPCQPFSQGGRNLGKDDHRDMIPDFQRCVAQILPEEFVLENVRGLASPRHIAYLRQRVAEFEALGYVVEWRVLDAAEHGVPQSRKRLFVKGRRVDLGGRITWPAKRKGVPMAYALGWGHAEAEAAARQAPVYGDWTWVFERPASTVVGSFMPEVQAKPIYRGKGAGPRQNTPGSVVTTQAERLILQQMPHDWIVKGSKTKVDLQIGNSCPNGLLKALLR